MTPADSQRNRISRASFDVLQVFSDGSTWTTGALVNQFGEKHTRNALRQLVDGGYVECIGNVQTHSPFARMKVWARTQKAAPEMQIDPEAQAWGSLELARCWGWFPKFQSMRGA